MAIFFGRKLATSLYFNSLDQWIFSLPLSIFNNYSQQEITFQQKTSKGKNVIAPCPRAFSFFFSFFLLLGKTAAGWNCRSVKTPLLFAMPAWGSLLHVIINGATVNPQISHRAQTEFCFDVGHRWRSIHTSSSFWHPDMQPVGDQESEP